MSFIRLQKWYDIILCYHSNRRGQTLNFMTLKLGNLWYKFEGPCCYGNRVVYSFHFCNGMKRIANFEKVKGTHFLEQMIFLKSINSLFLVIPVVALSCTCPFPIWCLGQDVEFDCISSGSLPFYLLY